MTDTMDRLAESEVTEVEFVDELPKVTRSQDAGVWTERVRKLHEQPGRWAKIHGPVDKGKVHTQVNALNSGRAAGVDPEDYEFAGRTLPTGENGEKEGFIFGRLLTDDQKYQRELDREAKAAEKAAQEEAAATA